MAQQLSISYENLASIIVKQINKFRNNPSLYLEFLQKRLQCFDGNSYFYRNNKYVKIETQEGVIPIQQLMEQLPKLGKLNKFIWSYQLHCVADRRAQKLAIDPELQANVLNGQNIMNRLENLGEQIQKQISYVGQVSEHYIYGYCDPIDIILELIVDDGNISRCSYVFMIENRRQLLNPNIKHIGIGIHEHNRYMFVIVLILATEIGPKINNKNNNLENTQTMMINKVTHLPDLGTNILEEQGQTGCGSKICHIF